MVTMKISLAAINDVKEFVNKMIKYDFEVDLVSGRYAIDAKSIMGIFSLDLSKPIELQVHTDDATEFKADIQKFIVE
jgi:phosphotransferase system HPr-like phosphotransfer protein